MPDDPSIKDVLARLDVMARDSHMRESAALERQVRHETKMEAKVSAIAGGLATLQEEFVRVKAELPGIRSTVADAQSDARRAMQSHDSLTLTSQEQWRSVMGRLDKQDETRDEIERQKSEARERERVAAAEARERESIAAKRVGEKREFWLKAAAIGAPICMTLLTLIAGYLNQRAHDDTIAKMDAILRQRAEPTFTRTTTYPVAPAPAEAPAAVAPGATAHPR